MIVADTSAWIDYVRGIEAPIQTFSIMNYNTTGSSLEI